MIPQTTDSKTVISRSWRAPFVIASGLFISAATWAARVVWCQHEAQINYYSTAGQKDPMFATMGSSFLLLFCGFLAFCICIGGGVLICRRKSRLLGIKLLICSLSFLGGCTGGLRFTGMLFDDPRHAAVAIVEKQMDPLIQAIETHHRETGKYPVKLEDLVPKFIASLPTPRIGRFTNYNFYVGQEAERFKNNPWAIEIPCTYGMNFDQLYYFPLQNYSNSHAYEPIGKWTYFHE